MFYVFARSICWLIFHLWCGYRVEGRANIPAHGPYIVAANHISYLDPPAVGIAFRHRLRFLAKDELFHTPWLGTIIRWLGAIPVTLSRPLAVNTGVLKTAVQSLRRGEVIAIFPEGRRNLTGRIEPAKLGIAFIAANTGVPIVPVVMLDTEKALPPGAKIIRRVPITARVGTPLTIERTSGAGRVNYERIAQAVTSAMQELYERAR